MEIIIAFIILVIVSELVSIFKLPKFSITFFSNSGPKILFKL